jgi:Na+/H+ antiporter NhaD/arsenite permease-like protein
MTTLIVIVFIAGYFSITLEQVIKINKAASALIMGVLCWMLYILFSPDKDLINEKLIQHLGEISGILFFLLGAMAIVELIDAHNGFNIITTRITQTDKRKLLWIVSFITFFLSSVLDNLTTIIVMVSLLRKLIDEEEERLLFAGMIIVAANAGGAWSPVGDVTTTMLWIGGQITPFNIISKLILPGTVCLIVPLIYLSFRLKGNIRTPKVENKLPAASLSPAHQLTVLLFGLSALIFVPVFKTLTHLPPFMGVLSGLGVLWIVTEIMHGGKSEEEKQEFSVAHALRRIDAPGILFFLGILLSVAALQTTGVLTGLAHWLTTTLKTPNAIIISIGLLSSVIDNVPLVAATQGMYDLNQYPVDHYFWEFLAYCTGTGGSVLIIGSAAGVAAMGIEKISFFWYLKKISFPALLGYFAGALIYILQYHLL